MFTTNAVEVSDFTISVCFRKQWVVLRIRGIFMVAPCISSIKYFTVQLMHSIM